jgi:hypothetical protein
MLPWRPVQRYRLFRILLIGLEFRFCVDCLLRLTSSSYCGSHMGSVRYMNSMLEETVRGKSVDVGMVTRAQGCLLGHLAGEALGSQVEFSTPERIAHAFPNGVRELRDGGTWGTIADQPTDDSEMALLLARMLVRLKKYDQAQALQEYVFWLRSGPFHVGNTIMAALHGGLSTSSEANGAMSLCDSLTYPHLRHRHSPLPCVRRQLGSLLVVGSLHNYFLRPLLTTSSKAYNAATEYNVMGTQLRILSPAIPEHSSPPESKTR